MYKILQILEVPFSFGKKKDGEKLKGTKLKLLPSFILQFQRPATGERKTVNSAWSFVHGRVLLFVKWRRCAKKTADSRKWFKLNDKKVKPFNWLHKLNRPRGSWSNLQSTGGRLLHLTHLTSEVFLYSCTLQLNPFKIHLQSRMIVLWDSMSLNANSL